MIGKVIAVTVLIAAVVYGQNVVQQCQSTFRDNNCMACAGSAQERPGQQPTPCGWCPDGPGCMVTGSTASGCSTPLLAGAAAANSQQCQDASGGGSGGGGGGGSDQCSGPADPSTCSPAPPPCDGSALPVMGDPPACCPSCTPRCQSGLTTPANAPACVPGTPPRVFLNNCTRSCQPVPPCADAATVMAGLPECSATVAPGIDASTGCPTCRVPAGQNCLTADCSAVRQCNAGEFPSAPLASNLCCPNCRPRPPCDPATCSSAFASLRECATSERPEFDEDSCCPTCRVADPTSARPTSDTGECTKAAIETCLANRPVCEVGETQMFDRSTSCCGSCVRPQRTCSLADIAECADTVPVCGASDTPAVLAGSCCPTCRPAPPSCSPACTDTQLCVARPDVNGVAQADTCLDFETRTFTLSATEADRIAELRTLTNSRGLEVLRELVERVCELSEFAESCDKYRKMIVRSSKCTKTSADDAVPVTIECSIPRPAATTTTRSTDSPAALVDAAATNDASGSEFTISSTGSTTSAGVATRPALSVALFALFAVACAVLAL